MQTNTRKRSMPEPYVFIEAVEDLQKEGALIRVPQRRALMAAFDCPVYVSQNAWATADNFDGHKEEGLLLKQALLDVARRAMDEIKEGWAIDGLSTDTEFEGPFTVDHVWHPRMELCLAWLRGVGVTIYYEHER